MGSRNSRGVMSGLSSARKIGEPIPYALNTTLRSAALVVEELTLSGSCSARRRARPTLPLLLGAGRARLLEQREHLVRVRLGIRVRVRVGIRVRVRVGIRVRVRVRVS